MKAGQFIASHGESFIGKRIQDAEKLMEKRKDNWHGQKLYNHIAGCVEIGSKLYIGESQPEGFILTEWEKTPYYRQEVDYDVFELYQPLTDLQLTLLAGMALGAKGTKYDFAGLADQLDLCIDGTWNGEIGAKAEDYLYCSEAWATFINKLKKGVFPYPWSVNPQMFVENPNIVFKYCSKIKQL